MSDMSQYNDLYIRMSLSDSGSIPRTATSGSSPDVIPYGTSPVSDPENFFAGNFTANVSQALVYNETNYIYVRMINYFKRAQKGTVYLYYALDRDLDNPSVWVKQQIKTSSESTSVAVSAEETDAIAVTPEPFVWTPAEPPSGQNWNLIAQVVTKQNPNAIPTSIPSLSTYVSGDGGIGWQTPQLPPPVIQKLWSSTVPYSQGDTARTMYFGLNCSNITVGSQISLSTDNSTGPNPPISLPNTAVSTSPNFSMSITSQVPADYMCNLTYTLYNSQGSTQPPGSSVTLTVSYMESGGSGPSKLITVFKATTSN